MNASTIDSTRPVSASAAVILAPIEADLAAVEARLSSETRSEIGAVRDISDHTLLAGGKRLRPAIALLCARTVGRDFPADRAYAAGAAVEMIHMATLMHDDVVDEAAERRGRPTANSVFGNGITVLTGDFLLAKSIYLLAHNDENLHLVRLFADVTVGMAEGEVLQAAVAHRFETPLSTYEDVIERKTARFVAGCAEAGGLLGGANEAEAAALRAYGHHLGMAFQIADDLLDFLGDPARTGKPRGTDLRDGRVTLPVIHALSTDSALPEPARARLSELLVASEISDTQIDEAADLIGRSGGFEIARKISRERAKLAVTSLELFAPSVFRDALSDLADYVVERDR